METSHELTRQQMLLEEIKNMSPAERTAFKECMGGEAAMKSGLPYAVFGAVSGGAVAYYGPLRKYATYVAFATGSFAYMVGKVQYATICLQKCVPRVRDLLKPGLDINARSFNNRRADAQLPNESVSQFSEQLDSTLDFGEPARDFETYSSFNDSNEIPVDNDLDLTEKIPTRPNVSYDELRERNRAEYREKTHRNYTPEERRRPVHVQRQTEFSEPIVPKESTKYGDVWG